MPRPFLFFDTMVKNNLLAKPSAERKRFWKALHAEYDYYVSPLVLAEIVHSLSANPLKYLQSVRRECRALRGPRALMLPLPGIYLRQVLFGDRKDHPIASAQVMADVFETCERLRRVETRDGETVLIAPDVGEISLERMTTPILEGQRSLLNAFDNLRARRGVGATAELWARVLLELAGAPMDDDACNRLAKACSAAYLLQVYLWEHGPARSNPQKHSGDWIDLQHLLYLANPRATFVTGDENILARIEGSGQEGHVAQFKEFWSKTIS